MLRRFLLVAIVSLTLFSCKKSNESGSDMNTWEFTAGTTVHKGDLALYPLLNTDIQANNTYDFFMAGEEYSTQNGFIIGLSLLDTTFTNPNYQSGVSGNDHNNGLYLSAYLGGNNIYISDNYNPGPVLNYSIESYNPSTSTLRMSFSGNVKDAAGMLVPVTNGKIVCQVSK